MKTKGSRVDKDGNKRCAKCEQTKPQEMFSRNRTAPDGREHYCKECKKRQVGKWQERNPDYQKQWYAEKGREYARQYYHENKEAIRSTNRIANKDWREKNRSRKDVQEKRNAYNAERNKAKKDRTPPWLTREQKKLIRSFEVEARRLTDETGILHHVDHIAPTLGANISGLHVPWNLQIITAEDNVKKSITYDDKDAWPEDIQMQMRHERWDAERHGE